jgi:uncharacterized protein (DUF1501 family)
MKRRKFLHRSAVLGLPLLGGIGQLGATASAPTALSQLLGGSSDDRVLVLIQLNGGNDGLNTFVPLDQVSTLQRVRPQVMLPDNRIIQLERGSSLGVHPKMEGIRDVFSEGKMTVVQSVGYPDQNRSHFRSTDIWSTASPSEVYYSTGWAGRYLESRNPGYPEGYPNRDRPHPLAVTLGNSANETCQGTAINISQAVNDPYNVTYLAPGGNTPLPDSPFGREVDYLRISISQTNQYGALVNEAAESGRSSATYPTTRFGEQLRSVARMIDGGLQTKVYVVELGGFDTHANQVTGDRTEGVHANLLAQLSQGIQAFQQDLDRNGDADRVVGMTYSEFGRRIRSNGSNGTDHGDAAPMMVFGSMVSGTVLGDNPVIDPDVSIADGVPMQYDFRDIYSSLLLDWFEVPDSEVRNMIYPNYIYVPLLQSSARTTSTVRALPVELVDFAAAANTDRIALQWQTASEVNNEGFAVERSTEGTEFTEIGFVKGRGVPAAYGYEDRDVSTARTYYYRLRQVDTDGTETYSKIVSATLSGERELTIGLPHPNPVREATAIEIYTPMDTDVRYGLYDARGRKVMSDRQVFIGRRTDYLRIRPGRIPSGSYTLRIAAGDRRVARKLIVR